MPKPKQAKPILKLVPPSPWLKNTVQDIQYWVHIPSRRSGIHIRGLARFCGVTHRVIQNAIRNAKKVKGEVAQNYKTDLYNLLKDKTIFLEEVAQNSPGQQGGPVKVICADVCGILIRYYGEKGHEAAMKSALAFMQLGIEQYIFMQVGFLPRPESVMINDIDYLIAKETVQVNKSRLEEAKFYTNPITGECGIDLPSLGYLCGGVALRHIEAFLAAHNEPFLNPDQPEKIVKAAVCAATLHHFGEVHTPRKTLAQYWSKALDPIVPILHQKTNYQIRPTTDRETQLEMRLQELEREVTRLRQLAKEDNVKAMVKWHRLMARLLQKAIPNNIFEVRPETATNQVTQLVDVLILKRPNSPPQNVVMPDGLTLNAEISLLSYKSHNESLNVWAIQELVGHYVGYRKTLATQDDNHTLPKAEQFQLYAVTTLYPQELIKHMGEAWRATDKAGVYQLLVLGLAITVIVTSQIPAAPHNSPWNLLSHDPILISYALKHTSLPEDLQLFFENLAGTVLTNPATVNNI